MITTFFQLRWYFFKDWSTEIFLHFFFFIKYIYICIFFLDCWREHIPNLLEFYWRTQGYGRSSHHLSLYIFICWTEFKIFLFLNFFSILNLSYWGINRKFFPLENFIEKFLKIFRFKFHLFFHLWNISFSWIL